MDHSLYRRSAFGKPHFKYSVPYLLPTSFQSLCQLLVSRQLSPRNYVDGYWSVSHDRWIALDDDKKFLNFFNFFFCFVLIASTHLLSDAL